MSGFRDSYARTYVWTYVIGCPVAAVWYAAVGAPDVSLVFVGLGVCAVVGAWVMK